MTELECHGISKSFGGTRALVQVSCRFYGGTVTALVGPNGAGKTTLLNIFSGFVRPDEGDVLVGETLITGLPPHRIARIGVGRTFQNLHLPQQMSVIDNLRAAASTPADDTLVRAIVGLTTRRSAEMQRVADEVLVFLGLEDSASAPSGSLSYGQQKLLSIGVCIAAGSRTLLLDEPFAGVHPVLVDRIGEKLRTLASRGYTVVLIEHDLAAVRAITDRTIALARGTVIGDGETHDVLDSDILRGAFLAG